MLVKLQRHLLLFATVMILLVVSTACGQVQVGVEDATSEPQSKTDIQAEWTGVITVVVTLEVIENVPVKPDVDQGEVIEVVAWRGGIHKLPQASEYDDFVSLQPPGTGEFGLVGMDETIEAEIHSLRHADPPNDSILLWGELTCLDQDYNGCQLVVNRMEYGPVHTTGGSVNGWIGTIKSSTFNSGISYVLELAGDYPMWYSLHASQKPELQALIEELHDTGAIVQIYGELLTGVPDMNGTRIEADVIGVIQQGQLTPEPLPDPAVDLTEG